MAGVFLCAALVSPVLAHDQVVSGAVLAREVSAERLMETVRHLAVTIGPRPAGSAAEARAASWIADRFCEMGYMPVTEIVPLVNGRTSRNVVAVLPGSDRNRTRRLIIGAHYDACRTSPGAVDNASGVAVLLELARLLKPVPRPYAIEFVALGAEERHAPGRLGHQAGSHWHADHIADTARVIAFLNIDMVGAGPNLVVRHRRDESTWYRDVVLRAGRKVNPAARALPDRGREAYSDHGSYEERGIPAAWLERRKIDFYHTRQDVYDKVNPAFLAEMARIVLLHLDDGALRNER